MHVSLHDTLYLYLLDYGKITWDEYADEILVENRPPEYATLALWLRNKGSVTKRESKEAEWELHRRANED